VLIEAPDERSTAGDGSLGGGDALSLLVEARGVVGNELRGEIAVRRLEEREGGEVITTEVLGGGVGRAACSAGSTKRSLRPTEEALEHVGGWLHSGIVDADEEMRSVALAQSAEMVNEAAGGRAETGAGRLLSELGEVCIEPGLGLSRGLRAVRSLGIGSDLMRDATQDGRVALYAPCEPDFVPVGLESFRKAI